MSYDIYIETPACAACGRDGTTLFEWNYTSNLAPTWRAAGADLATFHGRLASECAPILETALVALRADPDLFRAMDAPNGWGTYDNLVPALSKLLDAMDDAPAGATIRVSR